MSDRFLHYVHLIELLCLLSPVDIVDFRVNHVLFDATQDPAVTLGEWSSLESIADTLLGRCRDGT